MIRVHGCWISYYTGKLESYLRFRSIRYENLPTAPHQKKILAGAGAVKMPVMELDDGRWLSDSTPILAWFESQQDPPTIYPDFGYAGEDCDIYLKLEEVGSVELLEETLYYYRINGDRASLVLTDDAAFEMWRRLADKTIERIGLPLRRLNERQPFRHEPLPRPEPSLTDVDFVVVQDDESGSRLASRRMIDVLKRAGVGEDALRLLVRDGPGYLNVGFQESQRPLVCFVNAVVDLGDPARLETLVREMAASGADLASPKLHTEDGFVLFAGGGFGSGGQPRGDGAGEWNQGQHEQTGPTSWLSERFLLVRREVARAVGGVDEGYEHDPMAVVDFCLKARQRDFDCVYLGSVDFEHYGPEPALDPATDLRRLAAKWAAFPDLLAPGKD